MTRRSSRRGRPYQPYPAHRVNWGARLLILVVAFGLLAGIVIISFAR